MKDLGVNFMKGRKPENNPWSTGETNCYSTHTQVPSSKDSGGYNPIQLGLTFELSGERQHANWLLNVNTYLAFQDKNYNTTLPLTYIHLAEVVHQPWLCFLEMMKDKDQWQQTVYLN